MEVSKLMAATGANIINATKFADIIDAVLAEYEINTGKRISAFLAQVGHESGNLRYLREIWGPTDAQDRYEGRKDLGNLQAGDGKRFMGRGLLQTTGRTNYTKLSNALGIDFVTKPEDLEVPINALKSACYFWKSNNLNQFADSGDFKTLTKRINGGYNGLAERTALYEKASKIFV